jgi:hypothetical protein
VHFAHNFTWNHPAEYPFPRITTTIASITRDTAQSLGRVGLSSRHLSCDSRSTYRVSVRCVQNFESFSIDWCRCEVLSTQHLFPVSFCVYPVFRYQTEGQHHNVNTANKPFENAARLKYLGTSVPNQNYIRVDIKSRSNMENTCYRAVQDRISSYLLPSNADFKIQNKSYNITCC